MLTVAVALAAQGSFNPCAFGGLAIFTPSAVEVTPGTPVTMEVTLQAELWPGFFAVDAVIGSNDIPFTFAYSEAFRHEMSHIEDPFPQTGIYWYDVFVSGYNLTGSVGSSLVLGTVRIDTTALATREYSIMVDHDIDGSSELWWRHSDTAPLHAEPLHGQASITVVPEPGMLSLLVPVMAAFAKLSRGRDGNRGGR